ncbi:hypothetical protein KUTeg_009653 [Tegillarca granosa]|uniref:Ubiquitin fusion degradaton protein n=1 Tax=Tegillarca granosa TaxID=220873 RepID=A0ABQ9F7M1_TEGGR|nr:hypothetical protein KUTeg_009653 [Tegillarca granosa]
MFGFRMYQNEMGRNFNQTYRCYSVTMLADREDVERGGKIIMPPSALDQLTRLHIQYPMLFKLSNKKKNRDTHCGVLEFVADEGRIYIPYWMMRNLLLNEGDLVQVENVSLKTATFARFQPQSVEFLDITNPKAVLENMLRSFACLTTDDVISIKYNEKEYELCVLETKPDRAISIIECDMNKLIKLKNPSLKRDFKCFIVKVLANIKYIFGESTRINPHTRISSSDCVDFAPPVGYQEPKVQKKVEEDDIEADCCPDMSDLDLAFKAFSGAGNRLDGKQKGTEVVKDTTTMEPPKRGIPNYNYKKGTITFIRTQRSTNNENTDDKMDTQFEAFSGEGQQLRKKGRK